MYINVWSKKMGLLDNEEEQYEIVDDVELEKNKSLENVMGELGVDYSDDILLKVFKSEMGKDYHCFDMLPEGINGIEERLRSEHGKGDYKIKIFTPTPQGRKSIKKTVKLSITVPISNIENNVNKDDSKDIKSVINLMMTGQIEMMNSFRESQLENQVKTQELMLSILSNNNNKDTPSLLETMSLLKQLQPVQKDPMETVLSMMNINREIKKELTDDISKPEGSMSQLISGFNTLIEASKIRSFEENNKNIKEKVVNYEENEINENENMNLILKKQLYNHLSMLCIKAEQKKNPRLWAEITIDEIPIIYHTKIEDLLSNNDDNAYKLMSDIQPKIINYKSWFYEFIAELRDIIYYTDDETLTENLNSVEYKDISTQKTVIDDDTKNKS